MISTYVLNSIQTRHISIYEVVIPSMATSSPHTLIYEKLKFRHTFIPHRQSANLNCKTATTNETVRQQRHAKAQHTSIFQETYTQIRMYAYECQIESKDI